MQVSVENVGKLERKLTVKIPAEQLDTQVRSRLQEMGRSVRLKGFRPGKVPANVIEQRYGPQVRGEAFSELIRSSFQQAVAGEKLRPAMAPSIDTNGQVNNGQIEYIATFEILPEIGTIDVGSLAITKPVASVGDAEIDQMIETLRSQRRTWTPVDRPAGVGDMVLFEYSAQTADFRFPETGMERVGTIIGSGAMLKPLEDSLIGYKTNDAIEIDLAIPSGFHVPQLAGKLARADVKVIRVQESKLPDLDNAFVASFGVKDGDLAQFRADVRANLERELKATLNVRLKSEVVDKLVSAHGGMELPKSMVDAEAAALAQQAGDQARRSGQQASGSAQGPEAFLEIARRRVAAGLLLNEVARQAELRLDNRRVADTLATLASTYEDPQRVVELYSKDPQFMSGLQNRVFEDQVADWIASHAKVTEQALTFNEVMRPKNG